MKKQPRILMLTTQLGYGGAETSFIRLANYLVQSMAITVVLFTSNYGKGGYADNHETLNADIVLLDNEKPSGRLRRWWYRLNRLHQLKKKHDVCISFLSGPNVLNVLAGQNAKTVVSLRGPRMHDTNTPFCIRQIFQYILDPIVLNLAAKIVPVSSGLCNEVHFLGGPWTLSKVMIISPFIISQEHFQRAQESPPETFLSLKNQPLIVAVGRLSIEKNFQHLIPIFAKLSQKKMGAKLLLVGDGPMMDILRSLCSSLGLIMDDMTPGINSVIFAGYQKNPLAFMALGRVFVLPSGTEGVPNVLLEALATGIPIVAADAAWGARSILSTENLYKKKPYPTQHATIAEYGILMPRIDDVHYYDEWARVLDECLREEVCDYVFAEKRKKRVYDYDMSKVAPNWEELIYSLVKDTFV